MLEGPTNGNVALPQVQIPMEPFDVAITLRDGAMVAVNYAAAAFCMTFM
jgi:hypothetical protein